MVKMFSATMCIAFLSLPVSAQIKSAPVASMYRSVPAAWASALHSLANKPLGTSIDLTRALPILNADFQNLTIRASLAPVVMKLEARSLTPETVSITDLKSAIAEAKVMVTAETQVLIKQAASAKSGQDDLPAVVAKLNMLQGTLVTYLPVELRNAIKPAYEQARSKLNDAQRERLDALLRHIADELGSMTVVEAFAAEGGILAGTVDNTSFARRHSVLAKPQPLASKEASAVDIAGLPNGNLAIQPKQPAGSLGRRALLTARLLHWAVQLPFVSSAYFRFEDAVITLRQKFEILAARLPWRIKPAADLTPGVFSFNPLINKYVRVGPALGPGFVNSMKRSPDGQTIIAGNNDEKNIIFSREPFQMSNFAQVSPAPEPGGVVNSVELSDDSQTIVVRSAANVSASRPLNAEALGRLRKN